MKRLPSLLIVALCVLLAISGTLYRKWRGEVLLRTSAEDFALLQQGKLNAVTLDGKFKDSLFKSKEFSYLDTIAKHKKKRLVQATSVSVRVQAKVKPVTGFTSGGLLISDSSIYRGLLFGPSLLNIDVPDYDPQYSAGFANLGQYHLYTDSGKWMLDNKLTLSYDSPDSLNSIYFDGDSLSVDIDVPLKGIVYEGKRTKKFLFFRYGPRKLTSEFTSSNPWVKIQSNQVIFIRK